MKVRRDPNVHSTFSLPDKTKRAQEMRPPLRVDDSFKKIVLVKDMLTPTRDEGGIVTMSVYDLMSRQDRGEL